MITNKSCIFVCKLDFYYVTPELEEADLNSENDDTADDDEISGSTIDDLLRLPTRIKIPNSIGSIDILINGLSMRTLDIEYAAKTLKRLIIPRKAVQFSSDTSDPSSSSGKSKSSSRSMVQFKPYAANVRRSNRIAVRRSSVPSTDS